MSEPLHKSNNWTTIQPRMMGASKMEIAWYMAGLERALTIAKSRKCHGAFEIAKEIEQEIAKNHGKV